MQTYFIRGYYPQPPSGQYNFLCDLTASKTHMKHRINGSKILQTTMGRVLSVQDRRRCTVYYGAENKRYRHLGGMRLLEML